MRRTLALLLLLILISFPHPAHAQEAAKISSMDLWIWPEYDRPTVLIIERFVLSSNTPLPTTLTFKIPAAAEKPTAVAVGPSLDKVGDTPYTLKTNGDWVEVTVQVNGPAIQLEYYDPSIAKTGGMRQYTYRWGGEYAVEALHVEVQQPYDASNVQTKPLLGNSYNSPNDNLTYHTADLGALPANQTFSLETTYQKDSDSLTISFLKVQPSAPVNENTTGRVSLQTYLPWIIAGFGVLMITGGLYYYFRGQPRQRLSRKHRRSSNEEQREGQTYCPQCGTRARGGDRFCRTCGTRLRVEAEE
jgi:hypothetical protein